MSEWDFRGILQGMKDLSAKVKAELVLLFRAAKDIAIRTVRFARQRARRRRAPQRP